MTKTYRGADAVKALEEGKVLNCKALGKLYRKEGTELMYTLNNGDTWSYTSIAFNTFMNSEFTEYIEPLKIGEWVSIESWGKVLGTGKIVEEKHDDYVTDYDAGIGVNQWFGKHQVRKATPEEIIQEKRRRVFAKVGRNLNEFRIGDCVKTSNARGYCEVINVDELEQVQVLYGYSSSHNEWVNTEKVTLVYPVEQRVEKEEC